MPAPVLGGTLVMRVVLLNTADMPGHIRHGHRSGHDRKRGESHLAQHCNERCQQRRQKGASVCHPAIIAAEWLRNTRKPRFMREASGRLAEVTRPSSGPAERRKGSPGQDGRRRHRETK